MAMNLCQRKNIVQLSSGFFFILSDTVLDVKTDNEQWTMGNGHAFLGLWFFLLPTRIGATFY
jgi:hypothetical protein